MKQMKSISKIIALIAITLVIVSCASSPSLQKYYIDSQENKNFLSIDVPASIISLTDNVSPEVEEALSSLKKFNILAFKKDDTNGAEFKIEEQKVKAILKNPKFKELMRIKDKGRNIVLKYEGDNDTMDEVIVYASDNSQGFALVRVIGENMEPAKIMKIANNISKVDSEGFKQLEGLFKGSN